MPINEEKFGHRRQTRKQHQSPRFPVISRGTLYYPGHSEKNKSLRNIEKIGNAVGGFAESRYRQTREKQSERVPRMFRTWAIMLAVGSRRPVRSLSSLFSYTAGYKFAKLVSSTMHVRAHLSLSLVPRLLW